MKIRSVRAELFHTDGQRGERTGGWTDRRTEGQTDRQTDMTKLIVAFRNYARSA